MIGVQVPIGMLARVLCWGLSLYNLVVGEGRELRAAKTIKT